MSPLEFALSTIARGWYVLPVPRDGKNPLRGLVKNGVKDATTDEATVRRWWTAKPDANVGIACGKSRLAVLDCDRGNATEEDFRAWMAAEGIPETFTVRTGRRSCFGTHMYFTVPEGVEIPTKTHNREGPGGVIRGGELRSGPRDGGGYVLAAGSIHRDTKEPYRVLIDAPLVELPEHIRGWFAPAKTFDAKGDGDLDVLREALAELGIDFEDEGDKLYVRCPWYTEHSCYSGPSETALFMKNGLYCFKCHHSSCDGRGYGAFRNEVAK